MAKGMKLKIIRLSPEWLANLIRGVYRPFVTDPPLPEDLQVIDIYRHHKKDEDAYYNFFDVLVQSETFEELQEATAIPYMDLAVHTLERAE